MYTTQILSRFVIHEKLSQGPDTSHSVLVRPLVCPANKICRMCVQVNHNISMEKLQESSTSLQWPCVHLACSSSSIPLPSTLRQEAAAVLHYSNSSWKHRHVPRQASEKFPTA